MPMPKVTLSSLRGRWNGRVYEVIRNLGTGANGKVVLVQENRKKYALKLSSDPTGIALEYRLLQKLQDTLRNGSKPVQGFPLGPFVSDLDDSVDTEGQPFYFYTMEYIPGIPVTTYVRERNRKYVPVVVVQLLGFLKDLHEKGYAFGDLKAENILVNPLTGEVRLVDFGGVTRFAEGIRQYTEWYDRGYWNSGSRRADIQYDLFSVSMLICQLLLPDTKHIAGGRTGLLKIKQQLVQNKHTCQWVPIIERAWHGHFKSADEMMGMVTLVKTSTGKRGTGHQFAFFYKKLDQVLRCEWDWSHWLAVGSAVLCMSMILRLFMVK